MSEMIEFDPVAFSREENEWLLENIDKPPVVALRDQRPGVSPKSVKPVLDRVQELNQLQEHEKISWRGTEVIKTAIKRYLEEDSKWAREHKRNPKAPRFPSLYSFDSKGRPHLGGPGSDSGRVRTYFEKDGTRVPFAVRLVDDEAPAWVAPGFTETPVAGLTVNREANRIECFCGHTESFRADSRASYNAARARISKHLRKATVDVDQHRELYTEEFHS